MTHRLTGLFCAAVLLLLLFPVLPAGSTSTAAAKVSSESLSRDDSPLSISVNLLMQQAWAADEENDTAREQAEIEARIQDANEEMERAKKSSSFSRFAFRILLGIALIGIGIMLAGGRWKQLNEQVADVLTILEAQQLFLGIGVIAIAFLDFLLDLGISRPLIGDGLPQIAALVAGGISIKTLVQKHEILSKVQQYIEKLDANREYIGLGAIAVGFLHLLGGHFPLI